MRVCSISTHAPAGGATAAQRILHGVLPYFYSRPCGRGDVRIPFITSLSACHFYSRPCGRGDPRSWCGWCAAASHFYSRPCGRGDDLRLRTQMAREVFLLTPLREGRRKAVCHRHVGAVISTHAPAGGATNLPRLRSASIKISTHAPAGGATWRMKLSP